MIQLRDLYEETSTVEIKGNVVLFLESFAALWGLYKLLQGCWNNWHAYLFISSVCWQPTSPGDLAYRQQVKQTGNYSVTVSHGCCSIVDPRLCLFFLKLLSISARSVTLYSSFVPPSWSLPCHHFPMSFAYLAWNLNLYTTWKVKCGTTRLMVSGWVKYHNIWHCQMHYVHVTSRVTPSFILFHFNLSSWILS